jgi:hypothetical protein
MSTSFRYLLSLLAVAVGTTLPWWSAGCATYDEYAFDTLALDDGQIEKEIRDRLQDDPVTASRGIGIRVEDGVATLFGSVSDATVQLRAVGIARGAPGVTRVVDKLNGR